MLDYQAFGMRTPTMQSSQYKVSSIKVSVVVNRLLATNKWVSARQERKFRFNLPRFSYLTLALVATITTRTHSHVVRLSTPTSTASRRWRRCVPEKHSAKNPQRNDRQLVECCMGNYCGFALLRLFTTSLSQTIFTNSLNLSSAHLPIQKPVQIRSNPRKYFRNIF